MTRRSPAQTLLQRMYPGRTLAEIITTAYEEHGNLADAAEALGVSVSTLRDWMSDLGLRIESERRARVVPA